MRQMIVSLAFLMAAASPAGANPIPLDEREEGWFWYEVEPTPMKPEEVQQPAPIQPAGQSQNQGQETKSQQESAVMSTAWLRENIPVALERAMDEPTKENVEAYAYLQRASFDKSEQFALKFQQVVLSDPLLDENNRYPISSMGRRLSRKNSDEEDREIMRWLSDRVGFFYFHDASCQYCNDQVPIINRLAEEHDLSFMAIGIDDSRIEGAPFPSRVDDGHAKRFRVSRVPAIVMVWPENNAAIITQGFVTKGGLESRIVAAAKAQDDLGQQLRKDIEVQEQDFITGTTSDQGVTVQEWVEGVKREMGYEE